MSRIDVTPHAVVVADRLRRWLLGYPAKQLAGQFGVQARTADGWRQGTPPEFARLCAMIAVWGTPFIEAVLAPPSDQVLADRAAALARGLALLEMDIRDAGIDRGRGAAGVAGAAAGAAASGGGGMAPAAGAAPAGVAEGQARPRAELTPGLRLAAALLLLTGLAADLADLTDRTAPLLRGRSGRGVVALRGVAVGLTGREVAAC